MLYLLRHGRTAINAQGRLQGRLDPPLDDLGERQAEVAAAEVRRRTESTGGISLVISSPLERARQTAAYLGEPVTIDDAWLEMDYGTYEGKVVSEVPPDVWQSWHDDPEYSTQDGESFGALDRRVKAALDLLIDRATDSNVVVVSHMTPIKAAMAWTLGGGTDVMFRCHLSHAALTIIGFGHRGPVLHAFNLVPVLDA